MNTYAIIGGTLWGNRGAEAMVSATVGRVRDRDPGAAFLLMSYMADRDRRLVDDPEIAVLDASPFQVVLQLPFAIMCWIFSLVRLRVPKALLPRSVRQLRGCRALFDVSGISFHDGRLAVVAYNLMCLWPALLLRVPVVRLSQAMGPFKQPLNRLPARQMIQRATHTYARGEATAAFVEELGVDGDRWSIAADVAFAYRVEDSLTDENSERVAEMVRSLRRPETAGSQPVALVPSSLVLKKTMEGGGDYVRLLRSIVVHLHGSGHHVLVLPNATRAGSKSLRNNDIMAIKQLRELIEAEPVGIRTESITYVEFDVNTASIRSLLGTCDLVITSRFHAMVAGLALGIPTLVLGWSHKYGEVLEVFGCGDDAIDFSEADTSVLTMIDRLFLDAPKVAERIRGALPGVVASAESQFDVLDRLPAKS